MTGVDSLTPIETIYPIFSTYFSEYQPMLDSMGEIILQVDDNNWQGDSRVLYRDGRSYGYLQFGWGSCSGCDSLQACNSIKEVDALRTMLYKSIRWFADATAALAFFDEHPWEQDYDQSKEQQQFIAEGRCILGELVRSDSGS